MVSYALIEAPVLSLRKRWAESTPSLDARAAGRSGRTIGATVLRVLLGAALVGLILAGFAATTA